MCLINRIIFYLVILFTISCGGGTSGSGVVDTKRVIVNGTVNDSNGQPISDAQIVVGEESLKTDEQGGFSFETSSENETVLLTITKGDKSSQLNVEIKPNQDNKASISIVLKNDGKFVAEKGIDNNNCPGPPADEEAVCGVDGKNYASECLAQAAGVAVSHPGRCNRTLDCPNDKVCGPLINCGNTNAVCGKDNKTYSSAEAANSRGVGIAYHRACIDYSSLDRNDDCSLVCVGPPPESAKVCGMNGVTYPSECIAVKSGVEVAFAGACDAAENCNPDPVCGVYTTCPANGQVCGKNGVTYASETAAESAGVGVMYHRSCIEYSRASFSNDCELICLGPPPTEAQVCGVDGRTYASECVALVFDRVQVAHAGPC